MRPPKRWPVVSSKTFVFLLVCFVALHLLPLFYFWWTSLTEQAFPRAAVVVLEFTLIGAASIVVTWRILVAAHTFADKNKRFSRLANRMALFLNTLAWGCSENCQGTDLARALRKRWPSLPIVFMSGYANEATVQGNGLRPEDMRLMKPVQRSMLI